MNRTHPAWLTGAGLALTLMLMSGCGSTRPSTYFALQPIPEVAARKDRSGDEQGLLIGIGPILIPKYLDRSQIAVLAQGPEIYYSESNRWASPIEENMGNVLVQNLGALLATCRIVQFPWVKEVNARYWVVIQFKRFDGEPGGQATMDVTWLIYNADQTVTHRVRSVILDQPVAKRNYAALVEAESALLGELSRRIADDIRALEKEKTPAPAE